MSPESLLLNALKCHLVFAGSLQLTGENWSEAVGKCRACGGQQRMGRQSPSCLVYFGEDILILRILCTDKMRARAQQF